MNKKEIMELLLSNGFDVDDKNGLITVYTEMSFSEMKKIADSHNFDSSFSVCPPRK